jgi:glyoxylase-like metal-dependent hydrolase (beta-lactamase superfamily II)
MPARWDWYDRIGSAGAILEADGDLGEGAAMKAAMPKQVASGVYQLGLGFVNVFYVEDDDGGLWLVDAGTEPGAERIGGGLRALGRTPRELRGVVITHLHGDHVGGLAAVKEHTGAEVWMQAEDAAALREGVRGRTLESGPGALRTLIVRVVGGRAAASTGDVIAVEHDVADGEVLPFGAMVVATPGHTAGHISLLLPRDGGVLFAGDAATNLLRLGVGPVYEHVDEGMHSLRRLAGLRFETALFSHGRPLAPQAAERFRARFSDA